MVLPRIFLILTFCLAFVMQTACVPDARYNHGDSTSRPPIRRTGEQKDDPTMVGIASYMASEMQGRTTASGEAFDMHQLVAAHPTLPFGTEVRVTNLENGKSVRVRIIDRGPFIKGRVIDVSLQAAKELDFVEKGTTKVRIDEIRIGR